MRRHLRWVRFPHVPAIPAGRVLRAGALLLALAALAALAGPADVRAQAPGTAAAAGPGGEARAPADLAAPLLARQDSARGGPPISPLGGFWRSLVLPGWGQAELERPVRGAFYFLVTSASLWMAVKSDQKLDAARRGQAPRPPGEEDSPLVQSRRQQREDWLVLAGFWALMSGVDAWVSAHMYDFEPQLEPPDDGTAGLKVGLRVPLRVP